MTGASITLERRLRKEGHILSSEGTAHGFRDPEDILLEVLAGSPGERLRLRLLPQAALPLALPVEGVPAASDPSEDQHDTGHAPGEGASSDWGFAAPSGSEVFEKNLRTFGILLLGPGEDEGGRGRRGALALLGLRELAAGASASWSSGRAPGGAGAAARKGLAWSTSSMICMAILEEGRSSGFFARNIRMTCLSFAVIARLPGNVTLHSMVFRRTSDLPLFVRSKGVLAKTVK
mmetsp:Transcript_43238/g.124825  ORF Transcript_43238/g.124825 Transcript_43238/m.124825 type:complete len:234 (+) Transcript_43238:231-932(+)